MYYCLLLTIPQEKHNQVGENVAHSHACGVDVIRQESAVVQTEVGGWQVYGYCVHFTTWKEGRTLNIDYILIEYCAWNISI